VMRGFGYAACVPFGHDQAGVLLRLAAVRAPHAEQVLAIEAAFGLGAGQAEVLRYDDPQRGQRRAIGLQRQDGDARLHAFVLAGDVRAEAWIKTLLLQRLPAQALGRQLLRPDAVAPVALAPAGRQVCTCLAVGE